MGALCIGFPTDVVHDRKLNLKFNGCQINISTLHAHSVDKQPTSDVISYDIDCSYGCEPVPSY